ncbi:MAG TPA: alkaline phosphatase family protein [Acidimicrobiales bacterium]|nr:alkaline phosphatase family protein [Acidimicrobiales bacterium]
MGDAAVDDGDAAGGPGPAPSPAPVVPDYGGACLSSVVPALLDAMEPSRTASTGVPWPVDAGAAPWVPSPLAGARQVVLLLLDGLGWHQLRANAAVAPTLAGGAGGPIHSVAPTTTATALTSLTTGTPPAVHGVVGYRVRVDGPDGGAGAVLNVLRWRTGDGDVRRTIRPPVFQPLAPFGGLAVPAVTRSEFAATGFSAAHLGGVRHVGWSVASSLVVQVRRLLEAGEPVVYAYYDGLDKVAHEHGLGDFYRQELVGADRLVGDLLGVLPPGAALALTSDHGQVEVGPATRMLDPALFPMVELVSGEGRFRWLHARAGAVEDVAAVARAAHGDEAWVRTRHEMVAEGWFGGPLPEHVARRLGDVALVAHAPVAFLDPADTGESRLCGRHGSLTAAEVQVPLLGWAAPG